MYWSMPGLSALDQLKQAHPVSVCKLPALIRDYAVYNRCDILPYKP